MLMLWRRQRWWLTPTLLIAPAILLFFTVILLSAVRSLWISLHVAAGVDLLDAGKPVDGHLSLEGYGCAVVQLS